MKTAYKDNFLVSQVNFHSFKFNLLVSKSIFKIEASQVNFHRFKVNLLVSKSIFKNSLSICLKTRKLVTKTIFELLKSIFIVLKSIYWFLSQLSRMKSFNLSKTMKTGYKDDF